MKIQLHPEFSKDIRKFEAQYRAVSVALAQRFRSEVTVAIEAIKLSPGSAGHYVNTGSRIVRECRRRNLRDFPYFIAYAATEEAIFFASVLPSRSDPLTWLSRFPSARP